MPSNTEEHLPDGIGMEDAVKMLALQKAQATYDMLRTNPEFANASDLRDTLILGSDTVVYKDEILGKPKDYNDAFRMLDKIRGTTHYVATGVALINAYTGEYSVLCDVTTVYCKELTDEQIRDYIEKDQPYDKAGSYAIQGAFGEYIDHIEGDYENVMGLPFHIIEPYIQCATTGQT